ncbi:hypothetical protein V6N11_084159 [Hibiscus sabdariffa]|uniref:Uncharacterized protein n=2 Tax=Hibiscus sabdariffa TaxID=183260 RepID=A0ABR2G963_9ROSI
MSLWFSPLSVDLLLVYKILSAGQPSRSGRRSSVLKRILRGEWCGFRGRGQLRGSSLEGSLGRMTLLVQATK